MANNNICSIPTVSGTLLPRWLVTFTRYGDDAEDEDDYEKFYSFGVSTEEEAMELSQYGIDNLADDSWDIEYIEISSIPGSVELAIQEINNLLNNG